LPVIDSHADDAVGFEGHLDGGGDLVVSRGLPQGLRTRISKLGTLG
jgi:hypothetical protein